MKEDEMERACSTYGDKGKACRVLMEKPQGKRLLRRARRRLKHNIKMYVREVMWGIMDGIFVAQDRESGRLL
jgi:hypothetical protein